MVKIRYLRYSEGFYERTGRRLHAFDREKSQKSTNRSTDDMQRWCQRAPICSAIGKGNYALMQDKPFIARRSLFEGYINP